MAWLALASLLTLNTLSSSVFTYTIFSESLADAQNLKLSDVQHLITTLYAALFINVDIGFIAGRFGHTTALAASCGMQVVGYLGMWLSMTGFFSQVPFALLLLFCAMAGHGAGGIDLMASAQVMECFPNHKGKVNGLTKAYSAMSGATFSTIYKAVIPSESAYLLFLAVVLFVSSTVLLPIIQHSKGVVEQSARGIQRKFEIMIIAMAAYSLFFFVLALNSKNVSTSGWRLVLLVIVFGSALPFVLPFRLKRFLREMRKKKKQDAEADLEAGPGSSLLNVEDSDSEPEVQIVDTLDVPWQDMLKRLDFWVFGITVAISRGGPLMVLSHTPQILNAYHGGYALWAIPSTLAIYAVFNCLSRVACGWAIDALKDRVGVMYFQAGALVLITLGFSLVLCLGSMGISIGFALIGFGYGSLTCSQPVFVNKFYGSHDFGTKYAWVLMAAAIGVVISNTGIATPLLLHYCKGTDGYSRTCYDTTFGLFACASFVALGLSLWLARRQDRSLDDDSSRDSSGSDSESGQSNQGRTYMGEVASSAAKVSSMKSTSQKDPKSPTNDPTTPASAKGGRTHIGEMASSAGKVASMKPTSEKDPESPMNGATTPNSAQEGGTYTGELASSAAKVLPIRFTSEKDPESPGMLQPIPSL